MAKRFSEKAGGQRPPCEKFCTKPSLVLSSNDPPKGSDCGTEERRISESSDAINLCALPPKTSPFRTSRFPLSLDWQMQLPRICQSEGSGNLLLLVHGPINLQSRYTLRRWKLRFLRVKEWSVSLTCGRREFRFPTVAIRRSLLQTSGAQLRRINRCRV